MFPEINAILIESFKDLILICVTKTRVGRRAWELLNSRRIYKRISPGDPYF